LRRYRASDSATFFFCSMNSSEGRYVHLPSSSRGQNIFLATVSFAK